MTSNIANGKNLIGGDLIYRAIGYSCVSYTSRALWAVGIPNIGLHPYLHQASVILGQNISRNSYYLYQKY